MTKSVQDQINDINKLFPDNHRGIITPAALRSGLIEIVSNEAAGGGGTTGGSAYRFISANFAANSGDILYCDTSGGGFTVTLPDTPSTTFGVSFRDAAGSWGTNNLTIDPGSNNIDGFPNTFSVDTSDANFDLIWVGGGTGWSLQFIISPLVRKAAILRTGAGSATGSAIVLGRGLALAIAGAGNAAGVGTASAISLSSVSANWNPSDKHADITLSLSNMKATRTGTASPDSGVRGIPGHTASHRYFEITINALTLGSNNSGLGLATAAHTLSGYLGSDPSNGMGFFANGYSQGPGWAFNSGASFAVGDVVGIEMDSSFAGDTFRILVNGALADHHEGSLYGTSTWFPAASLRNSDAITANFGATAFAYSLPSGARPWNAL